MQEQTNRNWWKHPPTLNNADYASLASEVVSYARYLADMHAQRFWYEQVFQSMYEDEPRVGSGTMALLRQAGGGIVRAGSINIPRRIVETMVGRLGSKDAAIKADPSDADYSLKRRAKQFTKFIRGKLENLDIQELRPMMFRDACVTGTCGVHVFPRFGDMAAERVRRRELFVDMREARYGKPRQLFRRKAIAREVLLEQFGKTSDAKAAIKLAEGVGSSHDYDYSEQWGSNDMVEVWEGWHLPSGPDAKDGRHIVTIADRALCWEAWTRPRFPIAMFRYTQNLDGFWGRGLIQDLAGQKSAFDQTLRDIEDAIYFGAQLKVFYRRGSVAEAKLGRSRRSGVSIPYDGAQPPKYEAPNPVSQALVNHLQFLKSEMYEQAGIPEDTAAGADQLGPGASGIARMEFWDQQSQRYADVQNRLGRWHVDLGEIMIDCAQDLAADPKAEVKAKWHKRNVMEQIDWKSVDMKRDQYRLTLEPAGIMPDTRSGKLEMSEQLTKMGGIKGPYVMSLLGGFPDLDRVTAHINAPLEHVEFLMEKLEDPEIELVEAMADGHVNLELYEEHAMATYARAICDEAPEDVLQRMRDAILDVRAKMGKLKEAEAAMAPPMDPMAAGGAPPMDMAPEAGGVLPPGPAPEMMPGEALPGMPGGPLPGGGIQ